MSDRTVRYDSPEWRAERDRRLSAVLGDPDAVRFILTVGQIAEVWDDIVDGDTPAPAAVHRAFWSALVALPSNPFYARHQAELLPVMTAGMNAWMDSVDLERGTRQDRAEAYGLRDWYMELIPLCILMTRGYEAMREHSRPLRSFLLRSHETMDEYMAGSGS